MIDSRATRGNNDVMENKDSLLDVGLGSSIRLNRLRAGLTQVQLARAISRSGKFMSEVETGKARITRRDLERLADALGIRCETILGHGETDVPDVLDLPRRIRDVQPAGMTILSLVQLLSYLDRSGWLRSARLWMISTEPFPEENDLALVEQLASLVATKDISLRYVYDAGRLTDRERTRLDEVQGTLEALPEALLGALRWSSAMRGRIDPASDRVIGFAMTPPFPVLSQSHSLLWVETEDVSWSEVMPLLYCRGVTRTFENPNESKAFWYQLPRDVGSQLLLELAHRLEGFRARPTTACDTA